MDKPGKRGKIPQSDWPLIMGRYEAGETLSSIARTYDCSPPAISYIVNRSKAKPAGEVSASSVPEVQLIKAAPTDAAANGSAVVEPAVAPPIAAASMRRDSVGESGPVANGAGAGGEPRRTLHLSLGGNGAAANGSNGNGHAMANGGTNGANGNGHSPEALRPNVATPRPPQPPPFDAGRNGHDPFAAPEGRPQAQQPREAEGPRKDNGVFIGHELRSRVDGDIAAFLAAFDAALAADTHESRFGLREATDRLLRAGARTRIELERLEARVPLSPREGGAAPDPAAWRQR